MRALVFADRQGAELAPLTENLPLALLPVAGKEVLVHCIEDLVGAGVRELLIVVSAHADQIEAALGDGRRWGAAFRFVLSRGEEDPGEVWRRLSLAEDEPLLALRGDVLRAPAVAAFLDLAQGRAGARLVGHLGDPRGGLVLVRPRLAMAESSSELPGGGPGTLSGPVADQSVITGLAGTAVTRAGTDDSASSAAIAGVAPAQGMEVEVLAVPAALGDLRWSVPRASARSVPSLAVDSFDLLPAQLNLLTSIGDYHRANRDLVAGRFLGIALPGRMVALGLTLGRRAQVSPKCLKQGVAFVGANSRVHPEAELLGEVVIGDEVVVDRGATIRDSVILSRTYVGELVEVANAVVASNLLIRVDTGAVLRISDAFLLGNLAEGGMGGVAARGFDRLFGLMLLLLSLPLWPLAALLAAREAGGDPLLAGREYLGTRPPSPSHEVAEARPLVLRHWRTGVPVLRHLPWLIAVVRGDLRLVGVSPLTPEESAARNEDWQFVRDSAPVGLLGPTQLNVPADAPIEERLLSDAFYARQRSWGRDMGFLWQGLRQLFIAQAWRRPD